MPLKPEDIWENGVYRFPDSIRRVVRCDRVFVTWEFLRPSCAPPGHVGQTPGYVFSSEVKRFAAQALGEICPTTRPKSGTDGAPARGPGA
ncbi:hypothetical protein [Azospirillum griseum]|uniref:Uncharacterized protein n=1 Tax=Azospirillum griseum TaxID=2496639 RepID=A0A3S0I0F2_9PROT|nr:hypothetical protein [Azospirillum griseum]RTR24217.1 hypothetical protein EJ903_00035 [Azospirillum griseum]